MLLSQENFVNSISFPNNNRQYAIHVPISKSCLYVSFNDIFLGKINVFSYK